MLVAPAAVAAPGQYEGRPGGQVADDLARRGIPHDSAAGHLDDQVFPILAGAAFALAIHAVARRILALVAEVHQGGQVVVDLQDHVAAAAPVAAVRTAGRHVFLPVEGYHTVAAVSGPYRNAGGIHKRSCHNFPPPYRKWPRTGYVRGH